MTRIVALGVLLAAVLAGTADSATMKVVVLPYSAGNPPFHQVIGLSRRGAVGLLVPDAGPETSRERALAALRRGKVRNSLLGDQAPGDVLIPEVLDRPWSQLDPPMIVVGLPPPGTSANDRRYAIAVIAPGYRGILTSESTRIPGLVSIADVAPTALGREGKVGSRPDQRAGTSTLWNLDRQINRHRDAKTPYLLLSIALIAFLAGFWRRGVLAAVAAVLLGNLVLGMTDPTYAWSFFVLLVFACAAAAFAHLPLPAQGLLCSGVLVAYLVAMAVDERWVALSPLGPTQNARFYGLSNLLATLLLVPALAGAAILGRAFGLWALGAVAALALVTVGGSQFGADGGGVLVLLVGYAVLVVLQHRLTWRTLLAATAVLAVLAIGLAAGGESHVTDALRDGPAGLAEDLWRRLRLSWLRATADWGVGVLVGVGIAALAVLALRERRALLLAYLAAIAVSIVVNDSPNDVVVAGLAGYLALSSAPGVARPADERVTSAAPEPRARTAPAASP